MNLGLKIFVKLSWTLCYWIFTSQNFKHTTCWEQSARHQLSQKRENMVQEKKYSPQARLGCAGKRNVYQKG